MDYTIDPSVLQDNDFLNFDSFEQCSVPEEQFEFAARDSAVDLSTVWPPPIKQEPSDALAQFFEMHSPVPTTTRSPSADDMIFSNVNSPGDFVRDPSQTSSPETTDDAYIPDVKPTLPVEWNPMYSSSDAIVMPQSVSQPAEAPKIYLVPDKTKTRAETQIKMQLVVEPLDGEFIRFPRKTLAKPKHFASEEEKLETEAKGQILTMDCMLVCATAVETPEQIESALRRSAGKEPVRRRDQKIPLSELDKDDPAHPQNGGEVLICDGCKERERKRYDRKKKRTEDEDEFSKYENERVIMINEKEYKKWKDVDLTLPGHQFSSRAKQVDFAMRIACYCRHQEEKTPMGYRVIFTFTDGNGAFVTQHMSDVFHITDDHKNKEVPEQALPRPLSIPPYNMQYPHPSNVVVPMYQYPVDNQYALGPYSQPQTPVMSNFQSPMSPMDTAFPQAAPAPVSQQLRHPATTYSTPAPNPTTTAQYTRHQRGQSYFDTPMLSPTGSMPMATQIPRPQSFDNFNFNFAAETQMPHQSHDNYYASAPQSAVSTPLNLSRPASPTWEQGPQKKKTLRCVYFYVDDE